MRKAVVCRGFPNVLLSTDIRRLLSASWHSVCCRPEVSKEPETCASGFDTCSLVHSPYPRSPFQRIYAYRECPNLPRYLSEVNVDTQEQLVQYELVANFLWNASWRHCPPMYSALATSVELAVSIDILGQSYRDANLTMRKQTWQGLLPRIDSPLSCGSACMWNNCRFEFEANM